MIPAVLLSLVLLQDPQVGPSAPTCLDVIELNSGDTVEGRIVLELGTYLEIEVAPGAKVGLRKAQIAAVRRGSGGPAPTPAQAVIPASNDWYTLHDATGAAVGWLHATVTAAADGGVQLSEEWEFSSGKRHFQVTMLETADRSLAPQSCYFRERICEELVGQVADQPVARRSRVVDERIVEATVQGTELHIRRLRREGRDERALAWAAGSTFPLLFRQASRANQAAVQRPVFDPTSEDLATRSYGVDRRRQVLLDGKKVLVTEQVETAGVLANLLWRDASGRILRREVSGPSLVALPSSAELARGAVARGERQPAACAVEASGKFGLWRPNPSWETVPAAEGSVLLSSALHDAYISLSEVDHLDPGTQLAAAGEAIARWFQLLQPGMRLQPHTTIRVRGREALQWEASGKNGDRAEGALLVVVPWQDRFLLLRCWAPIAALPELRPDFASVIAHLELDGKALLGLLPKADERATAATLQRSARSDVVPAEAVVPLSAPQGPAPARAAAPAPVGERPHVRLAPASLGK